MTSGSLTQTMTIVCDNSRHARGKVNKISAFFIVDGKVAARDNGKERGWGRKKPSCKLCGHSLPDDPRVNRAVEVLAARSGGHDNTATLVEIAAIAMQCASSPNSATLPVQ